MTPIESLLSQPFVQRLGWALVHFVWQGALVGLGCAVVLFALRHGRPGQRYAVGCVALLAMAILPVATVLMVDESAWSGGKAPSSIESRQTGPATPAFGATDSGSAGVSPRSDAAAPSSRGLGAAMGNVWQRTCEGVRAHLPAIVGVWLVCVLALSVRNAAGWVLVERMRRRWVEPVAQRWRDRTDTLAEGLGLRRRIDVLTTPRAAAPTVIGWARPVILLPVGCLTGLTPEQLETVLAHELAHIRRHDYLVNLLQTLVETLLFYHPAVWWVSRRVRIEREYCCDDLAVSVTGRRVTYVHALATLEERRGAGQLAAVAASGGDLVRRIRRLAGAPTGRVLPRARSMIAGVAVLGLIGVAVVGQAAGGDGQNEAKTTTEPAEGVSVIEAPMKVGDLRVVDVRFEPIHQGKNAAYVDVQNPTGAAQTFGIHVYTRSPAISKGGMGWGKSWDPTAIKANERQTLRFPFKIHGPITEQTWLRLKLWHVPSPAPARWWDAPPGAALHFASGDLPQHKGPAPAGESAAPAVEAAVKTAFLELQALIRSRSYAEVWKRFTPEYQMVEFSRLEWFKGEIERSRPASGSSWSRQHLLDLTARSVGKVGEVLRLQAVRQDETWTIDFVKADGQWKVDWIAGYVPRWALNAREKQGEATLMDASPARLFALRGKTPGNDSAGTVVGTVRVGEDRTGTVTAKFITAVHGGQDRYSRDLPLGNLQSGARIELQDTNVTTEEHGFPIVKVKVLSGGYDDLDGVVGWVVLSDTSFAQRFDDRRGPPSREEAAPPVGVIRSDVGSIGSIAATHGSSMYGSDIRYSPQLYMGRLTRGAEIRLLDKDAQRSKLGIPVIKVRLLSDSGTAPRGAVGWVNLNETSFADRFDTDPDGSDAPPRVVGVIAEGIREGRVTANFGCAIYGSNVRYAPELYMGRAAKDTKIRLLDANVILGGRGVPVIKVKLLESTRSVTAGTVGWVLLKNTSFAGRFTGKSSPPSSKPKRNSEPS